MIFLDTNILSETMRKKPDPKVTDWLAGNERLSVISAMVIAEIAYGIARIRPAERSLAYAQALDRIRLRYAGRILAFDESSALIYGEVVVGEAERRGHQMSVADGIVAATALRHKCAIATRNVSHFKSLGLELINPWS